MRSGFSCKTILNPGAAAARTLAHDKAEVSQDGRDNQSATSSLSSITKMVFMAALHNNIRANVFGAERPSECPALGHVARTFPPVTRQNLPTAMGLSTLPRGFVRQPVWHLLIGNGLASAKPSTEPSGKRGQASGRKGAGIFFDLGGYGSGQLRADVNSSVSGVAAGQIWTRLRGAGIVP